MPILDASVYSMHGFSGSYMASTGGEVSFSTSVLNADLQASENINGWSLRVKSVSGLAIREKFEINRR